MTFIVFEGIDGSGKTTLSKRFADLNLWTWTREVRPETSMLLAKHVAEGEPDPKWMFDMFMNERRLHSRNVLEPILSGGGSVVCDRYLHSTIAYQPYSLTLQGFQDTEVVYKSDWFIKPDIVFYLDIPVEIALDRIQKRTSSSDRDDLKFLETKENLLQVQRNYEIALNAYPLGRLVTLDATLPFEQLLEICLKGVSR